MKVTIDVPAPTQSLELLSRLRQKVRNYKTSMKQLQRAHFITKALWERQKEREVDYQYTIRHLQAELRRRDHRIEALEQAYDEVLSMGFTAAREAPPVEPRNEAEAGAFEGTVCDGEFCRVDTSYPSLEAPEDSYEEYDNMIQTVAGNGNGAAHSRVDQSGAI